jgi:hypothetical protein
MVDFPQEHGYNDTESYKIIFCSLLQIVDMYTGSVYFGNKND